jgi:hypothetical protein
VVQELLEELQEILEMVVQGENQEMEVKVAMQNQEAKVEPEEVEPGVLRIVFIDSILILILSHGVVLLRLVEMVAEQVLPVDFPEKMGLVEIFTS